jgi:2-oxoisovalerate dehydrogenase E2 component (dihydrolipoyl transacylase)
VKPLAKPPVRKLAKDLGVDLTVVAPGSGPNGVITREDVQAAAAGEPAAATAPAAPAAPATPSAAPRSPRRRRRRPRRRR